MRLCRYFFAGINGISRSIPIQLDLIFVSRKSFRLKIEKFKKIKTEMKKLSKWHLN